MSSSVFYKFKNSREPERIVFDGTGISVFELKREIIIASGLGDGTDFNLHLYPEDDVNNEYKDDTTLIPRSATVIASRRPAPRGHGRAARYITGKAPVRAITKDAKSAASAVGTAAPVTAFNEADAEAAFLAESAQVWDAQKETLAHAKPVYNNSKRKPVNVPNHDPPPGYVCRRCNIKGHWIQACPTNDDPDFKPVFQAKRTTGIPRSFLKTVEKPVDEEAAKGVMLNADGEYVQVMTDTKTWEKFQEKANASKAQAASADAAVKEARERGLECPIDKRLFVDPVKTPCCGKTYCRECIDNALADGDLVCPNCSKDEVLMDDLIPDGETADKLREYEAEKAKEKQDKEKEEKEKTEAAAKEDQTNTEAVKAAEARAEKAAEQANVPNNEVEVSKSVEPPTASPSHEKSPSLTAATTAEPASNAADTPGGPGSDTDTSTSSKKRKASVDIKPPSAPKAMRLQKEQEARQAQSQSSQMEQDFIKQMEALKNGAAPNMPLNMNMPMPMMPGMPNMHGMPGMNGMNGMGGMNMNMNMNMNMPMNMPMGFQMPFHPTNNTQHHGHYDPQFGMNNMSMNMPPHMQMGIQNQGQQGGWNNGGGYGMGFQGQQGGGVGASGGSVQDEAYERQPVNARYRNRKARAPDFRYL